MQKPPKIEEIEEFLRKKECFTGKFKLVDIDPKPWSGHFNFLVRTAKPKFVLRFKGPEWGEPTRGIIDEYRILKYVEKYKAGPKAFGLLKNFFSEPAMVEEYLEGELLSHLSRDRQQRSFPEVAELIAKVNSIPIKKQFKFFREPALSYQRHKKVWQKRVGIVMNYPPAQKWSKRIKFILPQAEKMLDKFEPRLKRILAKTGPFFIFESAHLGHVIVTKKGPKFLNWEQVSYGDPSYTLAVFLASIQHYPDFSTVKEKMINEYLSRRNIPELPALIEQRLAEREVSNLTWILWAYVQKREKHNLENNEELGRRWGNINALLKNF